MLAKEVLEMSEINSVEPFADGFITALCPELIIFVGLILLIIVPNLGKGTVRLSLIHI